MEDITYKVEITVKSGNIEELKRKLDNMGVKYKVIKLDDGMKVTDMSGYIIGYITHPESKEDGEGLTCSAIQDRLRELSGKTIPLINLGDALKKLGFVRVSKRVGGIPAKVYWVKFDGRLARWKKAQQSDYETHGVKAKDFDNPDDFNQAVRNVIPKEN